MKWIIHWYKNHPCGRAKTLTPSGTQEKVQCKEENHYQRHTIINDYTFKAKVRHPYHMTMLRKPFALVKCIQP